MDENIGEEFADNEPEVIVDKPLTFDLITKNIGLLIKSVLNTGYIYSRISLSKKMLTDINLLEEYTELYYIDISKNYIEDLSPISKMFYALTLNASYNRIKDIEAINASMFLNEVNLENNQIEVLPVIKIEYLRKLNLNYNKIESLVSPEKEQLLMCNYLNILEVRGNLLQSLDGLDLPRLTHLYAAANKITEVKGLMYNRFLKNIHLRDNYISNIDELVMEELSRIAYVNLRKNMIEDIDEIKKLQPHSQLKHLVLRENPIEENEEIDYRIEVLRRLPQLDRLDKDMYEDEDREQIKEIEAEEQNDVE